MYSALRWERPAVRRVSRGRADTWEGCGKKPWRRGSPEEAEVDVEGVWLSSNRATKRALMDLAAAPLTCCEMMLLVRDSKGSICSARPSGEKMRQWCLSMSGFMRGSTLMRWAQASSRMFAVVVVFVAAMGLVIWLSFEGETASTGFEAMMRDVLGDRRRALVRLGSARRLTAAGLGFRRGVVMPSTVTPSAMSRTAPGVGVAGGSASSLVTRRRRGVEGAALGSNSSPDGASVVAFRLREAIGGGGGIESAAVAPLTMAARRADLRDAMLRTATEATEFLGESVTEVFEKQTLALGDLSKIV